MELLISRTDIEQHYKIAQGRDSLEVYIREAQEFMLKEMMSEDLYNRILSYKYEDILTPYTYTHSGQLCNHAGLKACLVHLTYAAYILKSNYNDTSFGFTQKDMPESRPMPYAERKDRWAEAKKKASMIWEDINIYLKRGGYLQTKTTFRTNIIKKDMKFFEHHNCGNIQPHKVPTGLKDDIELRLLKGQSKRYILPENASLFAVRLKTDANLELLCEGQLLGTFSGKTGDIWEIGFTNTQSKVYEITSNIDTLIVPMIYKY